MNHYLPEGSGGVYVCVCIRVIHKQQRRLCVLQENGDGECPSCNYIPVMFPFDDCRRPFREHANVISRQHN